MKEEEDAKNLMYAEYAELQRNFDHVKKKGTLNLF